MWHLAAGITKERKTKIQKDNKDEEWKKDKQAQWLMPREYRERQKRSE